MNYTNEKPNKSTETQTDFDYKNNRQLLWEKKKGSKKENKNKQRNDYEY